MNLKFVKALKLDKFKFCNDPSKSEAVENFLKKVSTQK